MHIMLSAHVVMFDKNRHAFDSFRSPIGRGREAANRHQTIRETLGEKGHDGKRQMSMMIGLGACVAVEREREGLLTTVFYSTSELVWLPMR